MLLLHKKEHEYNNPLASFETCVCSRVAILANLLPYSGNLSNCESVWLKYFGLGIW